MTSALQVDLYGVKLSIKPQSEDAHEPTTWRDVAYYLNRQMIALVANTISLAVDTLRAARNLVRGIGAVPGALAKRVGDAHARADIGEARKAAAAEWVFETPDEARQRLKELLSEMHRRGLSADTYIDPLTNQIVICLLPQGSKSQREDIAAAAVLTSAPDIPSDPADATTGDDLLILSETSDRFKRALHSLSPIEMELVRAAYIDGRSREDICRDYGIDSAQLRVILHRLKKRLRAEYMK